MIPTGVITRDLVLAERRRLEKFLAILAAYRHRRHSVRWPR